MDLFVVVPLCSSFEYNFGYCFKNRLNVKIQNLDSFIFFENIGKKLQKMLGFKFVRFLDYNYQYMKNV